VRQFFVFHLCVQLLNNALPPVPQSKPEFEQRVVHVEGHGGGLRHQRRHVAGRVERRLAAGGVLAEYDVQDGASPAPNAPNTAATLSMNSVRMTGLSMFTSDDRGRDNFASLHAGFSDGSTSLLP
jgi:hypothetical protein